MKTALLLPFLAVFAPLVLRAETGMRKVVPAKEKGPKVSKDVMGRTYTTALYATIIARWVIRGG